NVQYQLGKYSDPQTGTEYDFQNQLTNRYPELHPGQGAPPYPGSRGGEPRFPTENTPDAYYDRQQQMRNFRENPQMMFNETGEPAQAPYSQWQRHTPWVTDPDEATQGEPQP